MRAICDNAMGDNIFVKFVTTSTTTITPVLWSVGSCGEGADEIYVNDNIQLQRNATSTAWRVNINQWAEQDVKLYWEGTSSIKMFLCDTCKGFNLTKTNEHVKVYKELTINSDGSRDTVLFAKDELAVAAQYADADGFMYFRFNNSATGSMIVKANVADPEPTPNPEPDHPCVGATPLLEPTAGLTISLANAVNVYRIDYAAWSAAKVKLVWTGASPLHAFVADDCEFAVAIHHKDVVLYDNVEAAQPEAQELELDLTGLTPVHGGYLYVRFLTEKEGHLTIELAE